MTRQTSDVLKPAQHLLARAGQRYYARVGGRLQRGRHGRPCVSFLGTTTLRRKFCRVRGQFGVALLGEQPLPRPQGEFAAAANAAQSSTTSGFTHSSPGVTRRSRSSSSKVTARCWAGRFFWLVWGLATLGIVFKLWWLDAPVWLSTGFYLALGWLALGVMPTLFQTLSPGGLLLLFTGGLLYSVGAVVFALGAPRLLPRRVRPPRVVALVRAGGRVVPLPAAFNLPHAQVTLVRKLTLCYTFVSSVAQEK